jgi:hypothetical protein
MPVTIDFPTTDEEILACLPVIAELRPHLLEDAREAARCRGYGGWLIDWLAAYAAEQGWRHLELVSAVHRSDARRCHVRKGMEHTAKCFTLDLASEADPP